MDAKHTPGPWELRLDLPYSMQGWVVFSGRGENNRTICRLPHGRTIPADETDASRTNTANAELIARAPTLLADNARLRAALKHVVDHADGIDADGRRVAADADPMRNWTRVIDRAHAALKVAQ